MAARVADYACVFANSPGRMRARARGRRLACLDARTLGRLFGCTRACVNYCVFARACLLARAYWHAVFEQLCMRVGVRVCVCMHVCACLRACSYTWLSGWLTGWLTGWLAGWSVVCLVCCLVGLPCVRAHVCLHEGAFGCVNACMCVWVSVCVLCDGLVARAGERCVSLRACLLM